MYGCVCVCVCVCCGVDVYKSMNTNRTYASISPIWFSIIESEIRSVWCIKSSVNENLGPEKISTKFSVFQRRIELSHTIRRMKFRTGLMLAFKRQLALVIFSVSV